MNRQPVSKYVKTPEVSSLDLHFQWADVRRGVRRRRQIRMAVAVVAAVLVGGIIFRLELHPSTELLVAGRSAAAEIEALTVALTEGSEIVVAPGGAISLTSADDSEVVVVLERGRAAFDVSKRPNRRFVVKADAITVRVVGTKFIVQREGRHVDVEVLRGIVEVQDGESVTRLVRGSHWRRVLALAEPLPFTELDLNATEADDHESPSEAPREQIANPRAPDVGERAEVVRHFKQQKRTHRDAASRWETGGFGSASPTNDQPPAITDIKKPTTSTPADVFAAAVGARSAGRIKEAISGFQQVCERWPASAFAPMSAFEWGRLALENEDDPRQAARAFERTMELATSDLLLEDAVARLIEAYARFDREACLRMRTEYFRRFPAGSHVRGVTKACPP